MASQEKGGKKSIAVRDVGHMLAARAGDGSGGKIEEGAPSPFARAWNWVMTRIKSGGRAARLSRGGAVLSGRWRAPVRRVSGTAPRGGPPPLACPPADLHRRPGAAGCLPSRRSRATCAASARKSPALAATSTSIWTGTLISGAAGVERAIGFGIQPRTYSGPARTVQCLHDGLLPQRQHADACRGCGHRCRQRARRR